MLMGYGIVLRYGIMRIIRKRSMGECSCCNVATRNLYIDYRTRDGITSRTRSCNVCIHLRDKDYYAIRDGAY